MFRRLCVFLILMVLVSSCARREQISSHVKGDKLMSITVTSSAFKEGQPIPSEYSGEGANISPPLSWDAGTTKAATFALIVDDPDAPRGTFTHWVLFNIPGDEKDLSKNVPKTIELPNGALQGMNSGGKPGYTGPMPPSGTHRYFFKVYALDTKLNLQGGISADDLRKAMEGHVLAEGQLMGTYTRK